MWGMGVFSCLVFDRTFFVILVCVSCNGKGVRDKAACCAVCVCVCRFLAWVGFGLFWVGGGCEEPSIDIDG